MKFFKRFLLVVLAVAAVCVLGYSGYQLYSIYSEQSMNNKEIEAFKEHVDLDNGQIDWSALLALNPDIVAWIYVPDTEISFPVVYSVDDNYYLNHTYFGEESIYGSVFISSYNNRGFVDDNTIIYGHSTDIGGMFTNLSYFEDQAFFDSHPTFWVYTPEREYECTVYAFLEQPNSNPVYTLLFGDFREETLNGIVYSAMYTRPVDFEGKNLITLSTCDLDYGYHSQQRLVLSAVYTP